MAIVSECHGPSKRNPLNKISSSSWSHGRQRGRGRGGGEQLLHLIVVTVILDVITISISIARLLHSFTFVIRRRCLGHTWQLAVKFVDFFLIDNYSKGGSLTPPEM